MSREEDEAPDTAIEEEEDAPDTAIEEEDAADEAEVEAEVEEGGEANFEDDGQFEPDVDDDNIENEAPPPNQTPADTGDRDDEEEPELEPEATDDEPEVADDEPAERELEEETGLQAAGDDDVGDGEDEIDEKPAIEDKPEVEDDDDGELEKGVTGKAKPLVDKPNEEKRSRKFLLLVLLAIFLLLLLLVILGIVFSPATGPSATALLNPNITATPTTITETPTPPPMAPTEFPTSKPTPDGVTAAPTKQPTPAPVTPTPPTTTEISRLPCDEIRTEPNVTALNFGENNFKVYQTSTGVTICGDTFGGPDPERPNRNHWAVRYGRRDCVKRDYEEVNEVCLSIGARLCTLAELTDEVAAGTGCGGDRQFLYSSTECSVEGEDGIFMFDLGLRDSKQPFFTCETDLTTPSVIRCCGDEF